jgi:hypothetical protein
MASSVGLAASSVANNRQMSNWAETGADSRVARLPRHTSFQEVAWVF